MSSSQEKLIEIKIDKAGYADKPNAIHTIHFTLAQGELVGLIGANGAGKSTTIKAIIGSLPKFKGEILFDEEEHYAYVPEQPVFYESLTLWEHIEFAAAAFELVQWEERADQLLTRFRLSDVRHHFPSGFSKGMRQKVMLVLAFLTQPAFYIIDEPFIGLDPHAMKELTNLLVAEKRRGAAILMSTHVLDTAEKLCDRFLLIADGTLVENGTLADLRVKSGLASGSLLDCFDRLWENGDQ